MFRCRRPARPYPTCCISNRRCYVKGGLWTWLLQFITFLVIPSFQTEKLYYNNRLSQYYDEAWVTIYNATDGEPKNSNLVDQFVVRNYPSNLAYVRTCDGKGAKHVNKSRLHYAQWFSFELMDAEFLESVCKFY